MFVKSLCALVLVSLSSGQLVPPNSFPHVWPGQPKGDFSPEWQNCERLLYRYTRSHLNSCWTRLRSEKPLVGNPSRPPAQLCGQHPRQPRRPSEQHSVLLGLRTPGCEWDAHCASTREQYGALDPVAAGRVSVAPLSERMSVPY